MNNIRKITRYIKDGMYIDRYTVFYYSGKFRDYTIKGAMLTKHFDFICTARVTECYNKKGEHVRDEFLLSVQ